MTEIQWFAFVILPAAIALVAVIGVRLFERFHPLPAASFGSSASGTPSTDNDALFQDLHAAIAKHLQAGDLERARAGMAVIGDHVDMERRNRETSPR